MSGEKKPTNSTTSGAYSQRFAAMVCHRPSCGHVPFAITTLNFIGPHTDFHLFGVGSPTSTFCGEPSQPRRSVP